MGDVDLWWANGGRTTLSNYAARGDWPLPAAHLDFLRRTPLVHEEAGFAFVHAGFDPSRPVAASLANPDPDIVLWTRAHLGADLSAWEMPVVCGHTPAETVEE